MPAISVVAISGSLRTPSSTTALLTAITDELSRRVYSEVSVIEVSELDLAGESGKAAVAAIESADLLVVASPVYRATYTGAFKQLFDLVGQNALVGTPVLLAANGGDYQHSLIIDHQLRPLFGFFHALSLPWGVYATAADFTDRVPTSPALLASIATAVETALPLIRADRQLVSPVDALARIASGAHLIDVRSNEGRDSTGSIVGAEVVLKPDVEAWAEGRDKHAPVVVFCGSVRGSGPVAEQLAKAGFTAVVHVDGGFSALRRAGAETREPTA